MGELKIYGKGCELELAKLTTNDPTKYHQAKSSILFFAFTGGIIDDILVYRLEDRFLLVVNAANTAKDYEWIKSHLREPVKVESTRFPGFNSHTGPDSEKLW